MKKIKLILLSSVLMVMAFSAIVYTSCKKDPCSGVTCQNGGSCSGGHCSCPTGFYGNYCENTSISYTNDTYTPVTITVNGVTDVIPVAGTVSFAGVAGSTATVTAYTYGTTSSNTQVGDKMTWSFTDNFSTDGSSPDEPLDVNAAYFYLEIQNNSASQTVTSVQVNYGTSAATTDYISIPNNSNVYGVGYYAAYNNTEVYVTGSGGGVPWTSYPSIPNIDNASATVILN